MQNKSVRLLALAMAIAALMSIVFVACARPGATASSSSSSSSTPTSQGGSSSSASTPTSTPTSAPQGGSTGNSTEVHMGQSNFVQSTITISKGSSILLIDDTSVPHIIQNGSWNNGTAQPTKETGAPTVQQSFQGNDSHAIGPFNTAGTYHVYCTIHPGMNLTITVGAASGSTGGNSGGSTGNSSAVHMGQSNFVQSTITISKGSSIMLIDDTSVPHIIQNGSWNNGTAQPTSEPGAPTVQQSFQGNDSHAIGPFNTAGTYHLYCTIHPGMNLTVIVK